MMPNTSPRRTPRVSVLMPVYNAERYVAQAVESVLAQTLTDLELVVLDDGSTDRSAEILRCLAASDARVRLYRRENRGLIATRNELVGHARSEYCALLDADDLALPERLAMQLAYLETHPECVVVGSRVLLIDCDGDPLCQWVDALSHEEVTDSLLHGRGHHLYNPAVMLRRSAVEAVGGYREGFAPAEDLDLFLRLAERGALVNLPQVLTHYRQHLASEGYARTKIQCDAAFRAVSEARARRGMPPLALEESAYVPVRRSEVDHYRKWCWWALQDGHVPTARKYALATVRRRPLSLQSWRAMYCSLRGR